MADDLVGRLRAAIDDTERAAHEALHADAVRPGEWITEHHNSEYHSEPNRCHIAEDRSGHYWTVAHEVFIPVAAHIARHDPANVLRMAAAHRRILDEYERWRREADDPFGYSYAEQVFDAMHPILRTLADGYGLTEET